MNRKQKIILSITGIFLVGLILAGLTYAYFLTKIQGNTNSKSVSVTTADLELVYADGNGIVTGTNIVPGTTLTSKTFTVTNTGNEKVDGYQVGFVNVINTLTNTDDLVYTLTCSSSVSGSTCSGVNSETAVPNINSYIVENSIVVGETQTYTLTVKYLETNTDQSTDMNKEISFLVDIFSSKNAITLTGDVTGTSDGDYVQINSKEQTSQIVDGKYTFIGITPDDHTLHIKNRTTTTKDVTTTLSITKSDTQSYTSSSITIDDSSKKAVMSLVLNGTTLTKTVTDVNDGVELLTFTIDGTSYSADPGMTVADWVNSKYNTDGYKVEDVFENDARCDEALSFVSSTSNYTYYTYYKCNTCIYFTFVCSSTRITDFAGNNLIGNHFSCLTPDTLIEVVEEDEDGKKKRKKKKLGDIKVGDKILSFDWNTMKLVENEVIYTNVDEKHMYHEYDRWTFSDGTIIKTVHRHEFYNVEAKKFKYLDEWNIGEHTYKIDGTYPELISHEVVKEKVQFIKISGEIGTNYFANDLLTGDRNCPDNIEL